MDPQASEAAPAVLADLIAAGLVSHEMIGDPARLGGETACLRALCARVSGPVYRIDAYHYAFRAVPGDLDGALERMAPGDWTAAIEAALTGTLGADAVWLNATDLLPEAAAALARPLLLLRAQDTAVTGALEEADPGLQAVINARYAAECARLTADTDAGAPLAARLQAIEARQADILEHLSARSAAEETLEHLSETLIVLMQKIDIQGDLLREHIAQTDDLKDQGSDEEDFRETLGVTFAEFLAQIELRSEEDRAALRVPQFS